MLVGLGIPEDRVAPIGRRRGRLDRAGVARPKRERHVRVRHRHLEVRHLVRLGIEDRHVVGRIFRRPIERAIGIDRRLAPIRRDQIVQVLVRLRPVPGGDHDIALDARGPRRLVLGQFALRDPIGPVAEILVRHAAELAGKAIGHHLAGLAGGNAADPGFFTRFEVSELRGDSARRFLAELMTTDAVGVVHALDPSRARDVLWNVGRAAEVLLRRNLHHGVPVDRRIVVRRGPIVRCRNGCVVDGLAGLGVHLRRVDQAVAAHPDLVVGDRQIGDDIAALIVGDDALGVAGRQVGGFGDHPDAGLRSARARHHPADVVGVDRNRCGLLCARRHRHCSGQRDGGHRRIQHLSECHRIASH